MVNYYTKYLKYKQKYLKLKYGGGEGENNNKKLDFLQSEIETLYNDISDLKKDIGSLENRECDTCDDKYAELIEKMKQLTDTADLEKTQTRLEKEKEKLEKKLDELKKDKKQAEEDRKKSELEEKRMEMEEEKQKRESGLFNRFGRVFEKSVDKYTDIPGKIIETGQMGLQNITGLAEKLGPRAMANMEVAIKELGATAKDVAKVVGEHPEIIAEIGKIGAAAGGVPPVGDISQLLGPLLGKK
jgi:chromosome segregation ATPase